jgi:hypothetical protein
MMRKNAAWSVLVLVALSLGITAFLLARPYYSEEGTRNATLGALILVLLVCMWFAPVCIARTSGGRFAVFLICLFFGWTVVGWIVALVIAVSDGNAWRREQHAQHRHEQMLEAMAANHPAGGLFYQSRTGQWLRSGQGPIVDGTGRRIEPSLTIEKKSE